MVQEISIDLFEKNARAFNKKGLQRKYSTIANHFAEYIPLPPLGASSKYVLEVVIDKDYVGLLQDYLKSQGYEIIGAKDYFHLSNLINDYHKNELLYKPYKEKMQEIEKECQNIKAEAKPFEEIQNDDVKFFFLPYNNEVSNLCEFVEKEKDHLYKLAKDNDITIVMNLKPYTNMLRGFIGFNYLDAEAKEETVVDFSSNIYFTVDFSKATGVYAAALLLSGVTDEKEDLELMGCHILAENLKYSK